MGFCVAMTKNGSGSGWVLPSTVTWRSCITSMQGRLRFRAGAVDFIGQHKVGEQRAGLENELAAALDLLKHRVAGDVAGQQVGRELNALRDQAEGGGKILDQLGFSQAGLAFEEHMAAREQAGHQTVDEGFLRARFLDHAFLDQVVQVGLIRFQARGSAGGVGVGRPDTGTHKVAAMSSAARNGGSPAHFQCQRRPSEERSGGGGCGHGPTPVRAVLSAAWSPWRTSSRTSACAVSRKSRRARNHATTAAQRVPAF